MIEGVNIMSVLFPDVRVVGLGITASFLIVEDIFYIVK